MLNLQEVPDDLVETGSVTSDSTSVVSERPSLPKENVEGMWRVINIYGINKF